jgi:hypothetical protein
VVELATPVSLVVHPVALVLGSVWPLLKAISVLRQGVSQALSAVNGSVVRLHIFHENKVLGSDLRVVQKLAVLEFTSCLVSSDMRLYLDNVLNVVVLEFVKQFVVNVDFHVPHSRLNVSIIFA